MSVHAELIFIENLHFHLITISSTYFNSKKFKTEKMELVIEIYDISSDLLQVRHLKIPEIDSDFGNN